MTLDKLWTGLRRASEEGEGESSRARSLKGRVRVLVAVVSVAFASFQIYTAGVGPFSIFTQRSVHLTFALILCFALYPMRKGRRGGDRVPVSDMILVGLALVSCAYILLFGDYFLDNPGESTTVSLIMGAITVFLIIEAARRTIGGSFPLLALFMILLANLGGYLPGVTWIRPFSLSFILETLYLGPLGIWGPLTGISANLVSIFIIFGAIILFTGGGDSFIDIALCMAGRFYGGAAKMATVASALFGTISGSSVANVATTGSFTIPMMKRLGYRSEFAAAVEATASTGGQITPPIMGAGAFIMAEILDLPYLRIVVAAIIPAYLFYAGVMVTIHFQAVKDGLGKVPQEMIPSIRNVVSWSRIGPLVIPVAFLLGLMLKGLSPAGAAFYAVASSLIVYLFLSGERNWPAFKERLSKLVSGLEAAGRSLVMVASLIICAQIIVSMVNLTGIGVRLSEMIIAMSFGNTLLALVLTAIICIILGMGVPTTAAYILASAVAAPTLKLLGIELLAAHMFIFYYAILSALTPPVCAAAFVAAGIAEADWVKTAFFAVKLAMVKYLVPFFFVFSPTFLMIGEPWTIVYNVFTATVAVILISGANAGYFFYGPANLVLRGILLAAGLLLFFTGWRTDLVGLCLFAIVLIFQYRRRFKSVSPTAPEGLA